MSEQLQLIIEIKSIWEGKLDTHELSLNSFHTHHCFSIRGIIDIEKQKWEIISFSKYLPGLQFETRNFSTLCVCASSSLFVSSVSCSTVELSWVAKKLKKKTIFIKFVHIASHWKIELRDDRVNWIICALMRATTIGWNLYTQNWTHRQRLI